VKFIASICSKFVATSAHKNISFLNPHCQQAVLYMGFCYRCCM